MICETGISRELLDSEEVRKIAEEWNFPLPLSALLLNRGYRTKEEITAFLYPSVGELPSPFLLKDMDKAVARILPALEGKEKILIYGDYDADGITATALLWSYLKSKGVTADCRIPDRFSEGYGIREEALSEAKDRGIQLILTVSKILNVSFNQIFVLISDLTLDVGETIDYYVYRVGLGSTNNMSLATASGMFKSVIGLVLIVVTNYISHKLTDGEGIW